jgi:hypothetical protein
MGYSEQQKKLLTFRELNSRRDRVLRMKVERRTLQGQIRELEILIKEEDELIAMLEGRV